MKFFELVYSFSRKSERYGTKDSVSSGQLPSSTILLGNPLKGNYRQNKIMQKHRSSEEKKSNGYNDPILSQYFYVHRP